MKIKVELELDTDNIADRDKIEQVLYQLQQVQEILQRLDVNLNNNKQQRKRERH